MKIDPAAPQREEVVTLPHERGNLLERTWGQRGFEDGFIIERAEGSGEFAVIDTLDAGNIEYDDSNLLYGPTYKYRVCAYADQYKSDYSDEVSTTTTFPAPSDLAATVTSDQSIALSWTDNCSFEDGYEVWRKTGSGSFEIIDSTAANGTAYTDSGLTYGENYSYKVRAYTSLNVSNYSNMEPIEMAILSPSDLTLTALNDQVMQLSWSDNCLFEAGQELWKKVGVGSFVLLDSLTADITVFADSGLTYGETYSYKLRSFTIQNVSAFSDSVSGVTVFPAPSNLSVDVLNDHQVELTWDDNCGFEDGYEIQQLEGAGEWEIIDSVQANGSTYTISGLAYGVSYAFKVKAFTDINSSDFSDSVTGSTVFPAPSNLFILQSGDDAVLNWSDNCTFESGHSIERSEDGGDTFTEIASVTANSVDYTDSTISMYVDYIYRVKGFTEYNQSDYTEEVEFSLFTGDIIYVTPTGSDFTGDGSVAYPYKTVQKAIDMSTEGDMILVADGTYNESINYSAKGITVASYFAVDEDTSHISATTISAVTGRVVYIDDDDAVLKGLTITNGSDQYGSGVYVNYSPLITDCVITGNSYPNISNGYGGGIYIESSSSPEITNCTISNNEVISTGGTDYSYGGGVYCGSNSTVTFTNCRIMNNTVQIHDRHYAKGGGIYCASGSHVTLDNCVVTGNIGRVTYNYNAYGAGISSEGSSLSITESDISNNILEATYTQADNAFGAGIYCSAVLTIDNSTINNNYFEGDDYWGSKLGGGIYASSSVTMTDCTIDGNEYEGIYSPSDNASFTNCTISNSGGTGIYAGSSSTFENTEVTNSGATGIYAGSSSTFENTEVTNSGATGIYAGSNSTFENTEVTNSGGDGIYAGSNSTFENTEVTNSGGTGIYAGSSSTFNLCSSSGNTVYGFYAEESGFFTNCMANNNTSGGYYIGSYSSELINCLAVDNDTTGLYLNNSSTLIRNCTISGNGTGVYAGGNSGPAFMNVILYANTTELDGESGATMSFDYSDVQDGSTYGAWSNGTGNIDSDPVFVGSGDYHLQNGSPCIDAGNPSGTYNDADGSRNDMGAYGGPNGDW
jgi:parallel beta-helix repeat protein